MRKTGKVQWWNNRKGYGFLESEGLSVFCHRQDFDETIEGLDPGQTVSFLLHQGEKGPRALEIRSEKCAD